MTRITRVYRFAASHRLHAPQLPADRNAELYGKCNNPYGHGHNYSVHVSVSGNVNEATGRVIDLGSLDRYVRERVVDVFDHKDMNADVNEFASVVPTTENLAIAIEHRLREAWPKLFVHARVSRIYIEETPRNSFELRSL